jgi:uncharacterized delta-60 repeat protein
MTLTKPKIFSKVLAAFGIVVTGFLITAAPVSAAPGMLDSSFGQGGKLTTDFPGLLDNGDIAYTSTVQSDGKIIVAGRAGVGPTAPGRINAIGDFGLARYNSNGTLDNTFGKGGLVRTSFTIDRDQVRALAIQDDGKIVAAGFAGGELTGDFALARYNPNGSLDTSFGNGGKVTTDISGVGDGIRGLEILPNGKLLVAGAINVNPGFAQYNADGSLDTSFGDGGVVLANSDLGHFFDMKRLNNGQFIVVGSANLDFVIARFNADGSLDNTFGEDNGATFTSVSPLSDTALSMAIRPNGKIVVSGWANGIDPIGAQGDSEFALAQYTANGSLDPSFGNGGITTANPTNLKDNLFSIALQSDGKIVAAGVTGAADLLVFTDPLLGDTIATRYNANGSVDTSFGSNGIATINYSSYGEEGISVSLQNDEKIIIAGGAFTSPTNLDFTVTRLLKN